METLRPGDQGPHVEALQLALSRAGYNPGRIDGIFGQRTLGAVLRFQRDRGLAADGIAGPRTNAALLPYLRGYALHTVVRGDTFYKLAQAYGTTLYAVLQANPDVNVMDLRVGQRIIIPFAFPVVPTNIRYTSFLTDAILDGLVRRFPFVRRFSIGRSVLGREILGVSIGDGQTEASFNASHHANEWIVTPVLLRFLEEYAGGVASNRRVGGQSARSLFERTTLTMVPLVNPDGVDLVTGAIGPGDAGYERALALSLNYPDIPFPDGWKANIAGVDLNLQYPAGWENAREIKFEQGFTRPGPRDYVGPSALSEPESRAMYDFTLPQEFALTLSYHTQGETIYWRFLDYLPPRSVEIGRQLSDASGYELSETPYESGFAGYKDWFIQTYNRPGYTIEAGRGVNPLPLEQFPEIYRDNAGLMATALALA
jgi:g-D-glutamyl-meso-diaminopimelate peptidase